MRKTSINVATGFARNAAESAHPGLWEKMIGAWLPILGVTGTRIIDFSGRRYHGTFEGGMDVSNWGIQRGVRCLSLDGATNGERINCGDPSTTIFSSDFAWTALTWFDDTSNTRPIGKRTSGINGCHFQIQNSLSLLRFQANGTNVDGTINATANTWERLTITRSVAGDVSYWCNGVNTDNKTNTVDGSEAGADMLIGKRGDQGSNMWDGRCAAMIVHERELPRSDIQLLHGNILSPWIMAD